MKTHVRHYFTFIISLVFIHTGTLNALDYTEISTSVSELFYQMSGSNEGTSSFRSLLIPIGGRVESLGSAYTGLANDVSYIDYNPAASSILNETEIALFHNAWIADSAMESIAATTRFGNLGLGGEIRCFYVPFTEYDHFGGRVSGSYYSETTAAFNIAYNFLAGYKFKGLAVGVNAKAAWRSIPDYADDDTGEIISGSGLKQSALAIMGDIGMLIQFNLGKFYTSRDANVRIGLSASNLGAAFTGFGSGSIITDDPLPSTIGIGISYKMIRPVTITAEFRQPINLYDFSEYQIFYAGAGAEIQITSFFSILGGFLLKGGNPRFSLGSEFEIKKLRLNANYTLDLTSSLNPVNRISLSVKLQLGDKGRAERRKKIDELYNLGVLYFAKGDYTTAISIWNEVLETDSRFNPAIDGIKSAEKQLMMFKRIRDSLYLD